MTTMEVIELHFCYVHGYAHPEGEMDAIDTIPPELFTGPESVLPCHEEAWEVVVLDADEYAVVKEEKMPRSEAGLYKLAAGDLAYIFTVRGGLVPCKVLSVKDNGETEVRVTADRHGWTHGAVEHIRNPHVSLVSRSQVTYSGKQPRINGALAMVSDSGKLLR